MSKLKMNESTEKLRNKLILLQHEISFKANNVIEAASKLIEFELKMKEALDTLDELTKKRKRKVKDNEKTNI